MGVILTLETPEELKRFIEDSDRQPILLFKHSTRCPVSAAALRHLKDFSSSGEAVGLAFRIIHVIESRSLSDLVANQFGILHQSPQLLLIYKRRVLWHDSFAGISNKRIAAAVKQFLMPLNASI